MASSSAPTSFRDWIKADGSTPYTPERGRYHLYVAYVCPWAHATLLARALKGLQDVIDVTYLDPRLGDEGWVFTDQLEGCTADPINGFKQLRETYLLTDPTYAGRFSVPVLFDKKTKRIVNNESGDIIQIFNTEFNALSATPEQASLDLKPESLRSTVESLLEWVVPKINSGVYTCAFAKDQESYEKAFHELFAALDRAEGILATQRYLASNTQLTFADLRLFACLIRFDLVYYSLFKTNLRHIWDYPNLLNYLRDLYQTPAFQSTVNISHIKLGYYKGSKFRTFSDTVPLGPDTAYLTAPHNRK
eukprot:m.121392 g.121392  ORF g.121392 m.121392 type:complete len:305 (+) comp16202_c1_seq1:149-1063(+)